MAGRGQEEKNRRREVIVFLESDLIRGHPVLEGEVHLKFESIELTEREDTMPIIGFEASEDLIRQIEEVKERTDSVTRAEVLRKALRIYDVLTRKAREGKEVGVVDAQGHIEKLIIP